MSEIALETVSASNPLLHPESNASLYRNTLRWIDNLLSVFTTDDFTKGLIIAIPHYAIMTLILLYIAFANIDNTYWIFILFLIGILIINIMYRGCILMKCERRYFHNREWYGGYELLRLFGVPLSNDLVAKYYYVWVGLIATVIIIRLS